MFRKNKKIDKMMDNEIHHLPATIPTQSQNTLNDLLEEHESYIDPRLLNTRFVEEDCPKYLNELACYVRMSNAAIADSIAENMYHAVKNEIATLLEYNTQTMLQMFTDYDSISNKDDTIDEGGYITINLNNLPNTDNPKEVIDFINRLKEENNINCLLEF